MFDTQLNVHLCSDAELQTIYNFGVRCVVYSVEINDTCLHKPTHDHLLQHLLQQQRRLQHAGIRGFASCVVAATTPTHMHWELLQSMLTHPDVVAIGNIEIQDLDSPTLDHLQQHLQFATSHNVPLILTLPFHLNATSTVELISWLKPQKYRNIIFQRPHETMFDYIIDAGYYVTLNPYDNLPQLLTRLPQLLTSNPSHLDHLMLATAGGQTKGNILTAAGIIDWLASHTKLTAEQRHAIGTKNAQKVFGVSQNDSEAVSVGENFIQNQ